MDKRLPIPGEVRKRESTYNESYILLSHEVIITDRETGDMGWRLTKGPSGKTSLAFRIETSDEYGDDAFDIYLIIKDESGKGDYYLIARNIKNTKKYMERAKGMARDFMDLLYRLIERTEGHALLVSNGSPKFSMLKGISIKLTLTAVDDKGNLSKVREYPECKFKSFRPKLSKLIESFKFF